VEFTQQRLASSLPSLWWNNPLPTANSGFKLNLIGSEAHSMPRVGTYMLGEGADTLLAVGWNWKYLEKIHKVARLAEPLPQTLRHQTANAFERLCYNIQRGPLTNDVTGILRSYFAANLGLLKWKGSLIRPEDIAPLFSAGFRDRIGYQLLSQTFGAYFDKLQASGFSERLLCGVIKSYVPNQQLINYHTACNYFGAELACPFLDDAMLDLCMDLTWEQRDQKRVLKQLAERWMPRELVYREKCAFLMPMAEWINTQFRPLVDISFSRDVIERRGLFDHEEMLKLRQSFDRGTFPSWPDIWTFVVLEAWLRINLDAPSPSRPDSIEAVFPELIEIAEPARRSA
jgi:hypothetical protein